MNWFSISEACKGGDLTFLKKCDSESFDTIHANMACLFNQIDVLNYFYTLGVCPTEKGREYAKKFKNENVIMWLDTKNL